MCELHMRASTLRWDNLLDDHDDVREHDHHLDNACGQDGLGDVRLRSSAYVP